MSTTIRPEVSTKNKYWIDRFRYYELKHFCRQYPFWVKVCRSIDTMTQTAGGIVNVAPSSNGYLDRTGDYSLAKAYHESKISMVNTAARKSDVDLASYIIRGVTEGLPYEVLQTKYDIPCSRDMYYDRYRKFFWLLDKERC